MAEMRTPPHLINKAGTWYVKRVIRGERLRQSTGIKVGGERELKKAIDRQRQIEADWDKQQDSGRPKDIPTFGAWWDTYRDAYSVKKANPDFDEYLSRGALEKWQRIRLNHITKSMCEGYLNARLKDVSQGTVNRERGLLQAIFEQAIHDQLLERNPFKHIDRVPDVVRTRVLSAEEQALLMAVLSPQFQRWLTVMLGTGLRFAECQMLLPEHLKRSERLLHVVRGKGGKSRDVPLYPQVEQAIDAQWQAMGKLWPQKSLPERLTAGAELAGIPHIHPHALRHTFATRYLQARGDIFILSKILGHASVLMTQKQYVHLMPSDLVQRSMNLDLGLSVAPNVAPPPPTSPVS